MRRGQALGWQSIIIPPTLVEQQAEICEKLQLLRDVNTVVY